MRKEMLITRGTRACTVYLAFQRVAVPRSASFTDSQEAEALRLVNRVLGMKPRGVRLKVLLFIFLLDVAALLRFGATFDRIDAMTRGRLLASFQDSPFAIIRKGFWGLNTLAKLGVYGQPSVYPAIHYHPKIAEPAKVTRLVRENS